MPRCPHYGLRSRSHIAFGGTQSLRRHTSSSEAHIPFGGTLARLETAHNILDGAPTVANPNMALAYTIDLHCSCPDPGDL